MNVSCVVHGIERGGLPFRVIKTHFIKKYQTSGEDTEEDAPRTPDFKSFPVVVVGLTYLCGCCERRVNQRPYYRAEPIHFPIPPIPQLE